MCRPWVASDKISYTIASSSIIFHASPSYFMLAHPTPSYSTLFHPIPSYCIIFHPLPSHPVPFFRVEQRMREYVFPKTAKGIRSSLTRAADRGGWRLSNIGGYRMALGETVFWNKNLPGTVQWWRLPSADSSLCVFVSSTAAATISMFC